MKIFKSLLSMAIVLLFTFSGQAQISTYNLVNNYMKCWKVRGRLIGDANSRDQYNGFMVVGGSKLAGRILKF